MTNPHFQIYNRRHFFVKQPMRILFIIIGLFPLLLGAQVSDQKLFEPGDILPIDITTIFAVDSADWQTRLDTALELGLARKHLIKDFFADYPSPKRALIAGLLIPGGGQLYNGSFWKAPIVYGAYGTVINLIANNTRQHKYFEEQYFNYVNELEVDLFITTNFTQASQVRQVRDELLRNKEYSWIALFGVTLLSVADAFVECHLKDFDVSDDLSFEWKPTLLSTPGWGNAAGVGVVIPIRSK